MMKKVKLIGKDEKFKRVNIQGEEYPYMVSNYSRVYSVKNDKILKGFTNSQGYVIYDLYKNGKRIRMRAHRLCAFAFCDKPDGLDIVNHIDECTNNNHYSNLEWCTHKYNINYGDAQKRKAEKLSKPIIQLDEEHNLIAQYSSLSETSRETGIPISSLFRACSRGILQRDYLFAYAIKGRCG
jgi:hypothetical protein